VVMGNELYTTAAMYIRCLSRDSKTS
jgi:hypothetical protein